MLKKIKIVNIALTNKCNLHCKHCDIWLQKPKKDISIETINALLCSDILSKKADITLTGGDPFLHRDFNKIVGSIFNKNYNFLKTISTNGTHYGEIIDFLNMWGRLLTDNFSLHISLDGINAHNRLRSKSLTKILKNICAIKSRYPYLKIKLKFTISPLNYKEIIPVYTYAKNSDLGFKVKLVEYAKNYTNKGAKKYFCFNSEEKKSIVRDLMFVARNEERDNGRGANFIKATIKFLLGKAENNYCKTPFDRIFIMPDGDVYSCIHYKTIGNLNTKKLIEVWGSKEANQLRKKVQEHGCHNCVSFHGFSAF